MRYCLTGRCIALGVAGSIACFKSPELASKLTQSGAQVDVIMTRGATNFLSPLTFKSITHRSVATDLFDPQSELSMDHVAIAQRADVVVVAPATAHTVAKLAWGLADNVLTSTILATRAPVVLAPAMDGHMYDNPATQENIAKLKSRGFVIAGPSKGRLASGLTGAGRMLEPQELLGFISMVLGRDADLANRKIVVTAGGTQEPIDPVRVISNRSSGRMGYAIAEAARDRGARTTLISAPTALPAPVGVTIIRVETALEMCDSVLTECRDADVLIMAAAVADWRPARAAYQKLKKSSTDTWNLKLIKNPDIISSVQSEHIIKVGFAAETEDLLPNAQSKLERKGLHLIAANNITQQDSGFSVNTNRVVLLDREGTTEELPLLSKYEVGHRLLDRVSPLLH